MAAKIYGHFKTKDNSTITVQIYNKTANLPNINIDNSEDIRFDDEPVIITQQTDDTFAHMLKTQCKITLVTKRFLGDYLYANNTMSIIVNVMKGETCLFAGYVTPQTYNQNYSHVWEELEINCVDVLSTLENRRLTDEATYEELVAQSTTRPFSWFFDNMKLDDKTIVIPNLVEVDFGEAEYMWAETDWTRIINNEGDIEYYGVESQLIILDPDTAVSTGDTRIGSQKTPTYIQSEDTCIVDGIQYYKNYAWITINGEDINTGDWIVGDPTDDMPYVVSTRNEIDGWTNGVLPQPFDFYEHYTTYNTYSNGMEIAVSDGIGDNIPEYPSTTSHGSYYEFRQGSADDVDVDEDTGYIYYKDYAWVCVNNECTNSGQWQRGNVKSYPTGTHTAITGWQYDDPAVPFEYYETISHYIDYSDGTSELDYTTMGHQIPLTPNTTANGSYYEYINGQAGDYYTDPDTGFVYFKEYAWVTVNNVMERTNDWRRGDWIEQLNGQLYGKLINSASTAPTITVVKNNVTTNYQPVYNYTTNEFVVESNVIPDGISSITFSDKANIEKLMFLDIDTSSMTDMHNMFKQFTNLKYLHLGSFDTSNVTDMGSMFYFCSSLEELEFGTGFDTSSVTTMGRMFSECSSLTSLDVTNFNTSNVTSMTYMFDECSSLTSLDVTNFNTSNVTNMYGMFYNCSSLTSLDLSNFNTIAAVSMGEMFEKCSSLTSLDVTSFNTSNVTNMMEMFNKCSSLTSLDVTSFNTSNVTNIGGMFLDCYSLTSLDLSNFYTSNVTLMGGVFKNCTSLTSLDLSNFNTVAATNMQDIFTQCISLESLTLDNVSNNTFNTIGSITDIQKPTMTIYRGNYVYKWNSSTQQWEIQS